MWLDCCYTRQRRHLPPNTFQHHFILFLWNFLKDFFKRHLYTDGRGKYLSVSLLASNVVWSCLMYVICQSDLFLRSSAYYRARWENSLSGRRTKLSLFRTVVCFVSPAFVAVSDANELVRHTLKYAALHLVLASSHSNSQISVTSS